MTRSDQPPSFAAIVVAAGKGLRVGGDTPKQFRSYQGKPVLRHSIETLAANGCDPIIVVFPEGMEKEALDAAGSSEHVIPVAGGKTRQQSVRNGLEALASMDVQNVLIHDAARPDLPSSVINRLLSALERHQGAIPVLPVVDSLAIETDGIMNGSADREVLRRVQTPQAFKFSAILAAHRAWQGESSAGDDAQVLLENGGKIAHVEGDERLRKITFAEDLMTKPVSSFRIGQGFDVHRLADGEELWLCGLHIPHSQGLAGHSDADVALHALVDALLGAIGDGDIGTHFPPTDPKWKGAASPLFLEHAAKLVAEAGYGIGNVDLTIVCEAPKIGPHRDAMRGKLAELLSVELSQVSVKATTTERLGFTGRGEGIAAQAIVALQSREK